MSVTDGVPHFSTEAGGTPTARGRFVRVEDVEPVEFVEGLRFRAVLGENAMANFVTFEPNTTAPLHVHEEDMFTPPRATLVEHARAQIPAPQPRA